MTTRCDSNRRRRQLCRQRRQLTRLAQAVLQLNNAEALASAPPGDSEPTSASTPMSTSAPSAPQKGLNASHIRLSVTKDKREKAPRSPPAPGQLTTPQSLKEAERLSRALLVIDPPPLIKRLQAPERLNAPQRLKASKRVSDSNRGPGICLAGLIPVLLIKRLQAPKRLNAPQRLKASKRLSDSNQEHKV